MEDWLARARSGEIDEIVVVGTCRDTSSGIQDILVKCSDTMSLAKRVGCLEIAKMICIDDAA